MNMVLIHLGRTATIAVLVYSHWLLYILLTTASIWLNSRLNVQFQLYSLPGNSFLLWESAAWMAVCESTFQSHSTCDGTQRTTCFWSGLHWSLKMDTGTERWILAGIDSLESGRTDFGSGTDTGLEGLGHPQYERRTNQQSNSDDPSQTSTMGPLINEHPLNG